ncbi:MAG: cadherin-like beta sandwich domain-containing protein [Eubacterium sp.]
MREKISLILICTVCISLFALPIHAAAQDGVPELTSISFKNADIEGGFKSDVQEYGLILDDNNVSPTLESYKIKGNADIFVTYIYDETNHQTGITATLQYEMGSTIYNFSYINSAHYEVNSNNLLASVYCTYGELSPQLNDKDTAYKLYIPSDLTQLTITPVTQDINAYCAPVELILDDGQTPKITLYCIASDGSKREYSINIKRVDKTIQQVKEEMAEPDFTSFVDGTRLYQKPEFIIAVCTAAGGILILIILFIITRRIAVNPYDKEEKPFYSPIE